MCGRFPPIVAPDVRPRSDIWNETEVHAFPFMRKEKGSAMTDGLWDKPVEVMVESSDHFRCVASSRDAVAFLMTSWPTKGGKSFSAARRACLAALDGKIADAQAKLVFVHAADEAGILKR